MAETYRLAIDGEDVAFAINETGQAMSTSSALPDAGVPFLGADAYKDDKRVWSGVIKEPVSFKSISEQFSDAELERLYRAVRFGT